MRPFVSVVLILSLTYCGFGQVAPPAAVVPTGTGVEIELLENISSESLKAGQSVAFKLVRGLEVNGVTLLPAGTRFSGTVTSANPSGHWGKAGAFDLKLDPLKLADGALVRVDFHRPARVNAREEEEGRDDRIGDRNDLLFSADPGPDRRIAQGQAFKVRAGERYLVYVTGTEAPAATESPKPWFLFRVPETLRRPTHVPNEAQRHVALRIGGVERLLEFVGVFRIESAVGERSLLAGVALEQVGPHLERGRHDPKTVLTQRVEVALDLGCILRVEVTVIGSGRHNRRGTFPSSRRIPPPLLEVMRA